MRFLVGLRRVLSVDQPSTAPPAHLARSDEATVVELEHAWRTYEALQAAIARTETKATFLVTIESALLVFFVTMIGTDGVFADFQKVLVYIAGLLAFGGTLWLFVAIIALVRVIVPHRSETDLAAHFAERDPTAIAQSLRHNDALLTLSHHLRVTSEAAINKDLLLAKSVRLGLSGFGLVMLATLLVAVVDHFHLDFGP
jgi:hypothetical protein